MATLAQALLWTLVPTLTYSAPPGNVPLVLAAGHEWVAGSRLGPPPANWLAENPFDLFGPRLFRIYLLSQVSVVTGFWLGFFLGPALFVPPHPLLPPSRVPPHP